MHDLDRTLTELEAETEYEDEYDADNELELEGDDYEFEDEEHEAEDEYSEPESADDDPISVLSDAEEMEMASDLLNVTSDEELEQFLGKLFRKVRRKARGLVRRGRRFFKRGVGRRLAQGLRRVARRSLPMIGRAVGGAFGGPAGAIAGGAAAPQIGRIFGLELEGMSPEDQEFEAARRVVRLAADATAKAASGSQTPAPPSAIVRNAMTQAARRHAPGLLARSVDQVPSSAGGRRHSGRWVRRGNRIVIMGA